MEKRGKVSTKNPQPHGAGSVVSDPAFNPDDILLDDDNLLRDRLLRSLHRNGDGHLAAASNRHKQAIEAVHNMAVLFCYTCEDDEYTMHEHYLYAPDARGYKQWSKLALNEAINLHKYSEDNFHGVFGWVTAYVKITPLRNGDLFIKIDVEGARGVRLTFSAGKSKYATRNEKNAEAKRKRSNRRG